MRLVLRDLFTSFSLYEENGALTKVKNVRRNKKKAITRKKPSTDLAISSKLPSMVLYCSSAIERTRSPTRIKSPRVLTYRARMLLK